MAHLSAKYITPEEAARHVWRHFGDLGQAEAVKALAVAWAESGGFNVNAHNSSGEDSRGMFQVNVVSAANPRFASWDLYNPDKAAEAARIIRGEWGGFCAWSVYEESCGAGRIGTYRQYISRCTTLIRDAASGGGTPNPPSGQTSAPSLIYPCPPYNQITSGGGFYDWRAELERLHAAVDFNAPNDAAVRACHAGRVTVAGDGGRETGIMVEIRSGEWCTRYLHLKSVAVQVGKDVAQGANIGRSDNTGLSYGDHLHLALTADTEAAARTVQADPVKTFGRWSVNPMLRMAGVNPGTPPNPVPDPTPTEYYTVRSGDTLSGIASRAWANPNLWPALYVENFDAIGPNPNVIRTGQVFLVTTKGNALDIALKWAALPATMSAADKVKRIRDQQPVFTPPPPKPPDPTPPPKPPKEPDFPAIPTPDLPDADPKEKGSPAEFGATYDLTGASSKMNVYVAAAKDTRQKWRARVVPTPLTDFRREGR